MLESFVLGGLAGGSIGGDPAKQGKVVTARNTKTIRKATLLLMVPPFSTRQQVKSTMFQFGSRAAGGNRGFQRLSLTHPAVVVLNRLRYRADIHP
jgi:hypothetical protein